MTDVHNLSDIGNDERSSRVLGKFNKQKLNKRAFIMLMIFLVLGFGTAVLRLGYLQLIMGDELRQKAVDQQLGDITVSAKRGDIYDRNGKVLAQSASVWKLIMAPIYIKTDEQRQYVTDGLAEIFGYDEEEKNDLFEKTDRDTYYVTIESKIESDVREEILTFLDEMEEKKFKIYDSETQKYNDETLNSNVLYLQDDYKRYYPYGDLASAVIGFTGSDDQGLSGLEIQYDEELSGKPGRTVSAINAIGINMPFQYEQNVEPEDGYSIVTTIDETIQSICEKYLKEAIETYQVANRAAAIAMNPSTGEIYAIAVEGGYDLNDPYTIANEETAAEIEALPEEEQDKAYSDALQQQWRNKAISDVYYPGSVFKPIVASMVLEEGLVDENTKFYCNNATITVGSTDIHCHIYWPGSGNEHGEQNIVQALWNSCNPALVQMGQIAGVDTFWEYYQAFGFSEKTGVDLPGESEDIFFGHEMTELDLAVSSFGQGFAVTPMQMITAISAIANGGYLMQPYIVKEIVDSDGNIVETTTPTVKRQVISKEVSEQLNEILYGNVNEGGATNGYVAGYEVAGKTGTSEKLNDNKDHIASFCGYAPYDDPQIVLLLYFDSPRGVLYHGSTVAAPVFASIMEEVLPYLEVERHYTEEELENIDTTANTYIGLSIDEATSKVEDDGFEAVVKGSGSTVIAQVPESGTKIPNSGKVVLYTDDASKEEKVIVPDFSGLTVTEASQKAAEYNLNISITGATNVYNSVVQTQSIDSGKEVSPGTVVTLTFMGAGIGD